MITVNQQLINLGRLVRGANHNFKYTIRNTSDKPATIENITVGCGSCTQASTDKSVIEAGGSTDINVVFTPNSSGAQLKRITVAFVGGGKLELKFSAEVA